MNTPTHIYGGDVTISGNVDCINVYGGKAIVQGACRHINQYGGVIFPFTNSTEHTEHLRRQYDDMRIKYDKLLKAHNAKEARINDLLYELRQERAKGRMKPAEIIRLEDELAAKIHRYDLLLEDADNEVRIIRRVFDERLQEERDTNAALRQEIDGLRAKVAQLEARVDSLERHTPHPHSTGYDTDAWDVKPTKEGARKISEMFGIFVTDELVTIE